MTPRPRTILAMGGGGFTMEPQNPALDEFILSLAGRREPRILLLPTASGDSEEQAGRFHATYDDRGCTASVLSLFRLGLRGPVDLRALVLEQDVVYVGGGSLRNMLAIWREHGLDQVLREAWAAGVVLAGLSAGAMCWFEGGVTKSSGEPEPVDGLGLLPGSLTVHADGEPERLPVYERAVATGRLPAGWAADDGVGLLFRETSLERVVSSRPGRQALRIEPDGEGGVQRTTLGPEELARPAALGDRPVPGDVLEFRRARRGPGGYRAARR
jgi:peptidase E